MTITIALDALTGTYDVVIVDDALVEGDEIGTLTLTGFAAVT